MVLTKAIWIGCIVTFSWIPDVLWMQRSVWVLLDLEVSVPAHEEPVKWTALAIREWIPPLNILCVEHRVSCQITLWLLNHRCEWLKVRSIVPSVRAFEVDIGRIMGEYQAYDHCRTKGIPSEVVASCPAWINLREVVHETILVNYGHSTSCLLVITAYHGCKRPEEPCSDQPVG